MALIVLIEDDPLIRELIQEILMNDGHERVITTEDGNEGLAAVRQHRPNLVITDLVMPDKDGAAVIRELKKEFPTLPIIAISGGGFNSSQYYLKIAEQLGSDCIIPKPVDDRVLLQAVNKLLQSPTEYDLD